MVNLKYSEKTVLPILVAVVLFMEFLDITIINTAIPSIARDFNASPILLKFSATSYFLSLAIFIPISGWCTDKLGTRKTFLFSILLFVIASFLCTLAHNILQLSLFRFLQGVGGAFMNPVSRIIIVRLFPPKELVRVQGVIFTPALLGQVLGPFLGGLIAGYLSWHWIFYINIPIGLLAIYVGSNYITQEIDAQIKKFDWFGFIVAAFALSAISFCVEMLNHYELVPEYLVLAIGGIGMLLFCVLIAHCLRSQHPVLDFSLLKIKTFRIGFSINLTMYALNASIAFLLPLMYQESFGLRSSIAGMIVLPVAFGYLSFRMFAPKFIHQFGFRRILCIASSLLIVLIFLLGTITRDASIYYIIVVEFLYGACFILVGSSTGALNYIDVPKTRISMATATDMTFRQFSGSFGIGLSAFCLTSLAQYFALDIFSGNAKVFHYTFYILTVLAIIATINALALNKNDGEHALRH